MLNKIFILSSTLIILIIGFQYVNIFRTNSATNSSQQKPNIIIFLADDLGWNDIGFHLSKHISTPNIDSLAADGIVLNRYYTQPLCTPSRGALLTGIHPIHTGLQNFVLLSAAPWGLPLETKLLPHYLKDYGYSTHAIGKWHLGFARKEYTPTFRGFDSHLGYWTGYHDYYNYSNLERGLIGLDLRNNLDVIKNASGIYSTEYFTDSALNLISNHNNSEPLFLYLSYPNVHAGNEYDKLQAPQQLIKRFSYIKDNNRRIFAANAYSMDQSIGKIVDKLNEKNILNNSIILFLSDNGAAFSGFMENEGSNYPLRGTKGTLWEGGVRVPAFIWSPLLKNSGYVSNSTIHVTDILPTLIEAIDEKYSTKIHNKIDGNSIWDFLSNKKTSAQNELLLNIDPIWNMSSIIENNWKLIQGLISNTISEKSSEYSPSYEVSDYENPTLVQRLKFERINSTVFKVLQKLKRNPNYDIFNETVIDCGVKNIAKCDLSQELCLFDLRSDPCEYNNLAKNYPQIVNKLWTKILNYNKTAVKPLIQPIDPKANPIYHNNIWDYWIN